MTTRPKAARQRISNAIGTVTDTALAGFRDDPQAFGVSGTVVYDCGGTTRVTVQDEETGELTEIEGRVNIIKTTYQTAGMKYAVTFDGNMRFVAGAFTEFPTLAEAAEFCGA